MATTTRSTPVSALHEILTWSVNRPAWQRDALRRIIAQDELTAADVKELDRLCRSAHKADISTDPPIIAEPLTKAHLPPAPGAESSVTLISIGNLQRVNRLPSDQVLTFGDAPGLTVIYGDNGSGKSGYARVIKKACRTRGTPSPIRPNAFAPRTSQPASADIVCRVAGTRSTISWDDSTTSDSLLANVFVFDASTAGHYLQEDGPAAFTPHGLDVLPSLSKACDAVSSLIQRDIDAERADITAAAKNWRVTSTTAVGRMIGGLSAVTKLADIEALSALTAQQTQRLAELNEALKTDPKQKAKESRASATRLRTFGTNVAAIARELSDAQALTLRRLIEDAVTTATAAQSFAKGQFDSSFLAGTGSDLWRELWEAARSYATAEAYPDQPFPLVTGDSRCVLCQQTLDAPSAARLTTFESFCKDQSQQLAATAAKALVDAAERIKSLEALTTPYAQVEADLVAATAEVKAAIAAYVAAADARLSTVSSSIRTRTWIDPTALPTSPEPDILKLATAIEARADMEESADDPAVRAKLTSERDEFAARDWLAGVKDDVLVQVERYKRIALLETCKKDTATRAVTEKSTELTKQIVTDAFCKRFETEVKVLGLRTITVRMEDIKGTKGETRFGLRLTGAPNHKVHEIASEGEQRCIALAAFLAELSQASHQSALVFDDPVSSLDHWHRERIAARLVQESKVRQVIVMTHDAVFLNDLQTQSHDHAVPATFRYIEWIGSNPGRCHDGLPWDCKSPEDRLDRLEKEHRDIVAAWQPQPNQANIADMRRAYSWLRATIERVVERVVFADVVFRFRSYVKLRDLRNVVGFTSSECDELLRLHQRCCDVTEAHDSASGKQAPIPEPTELAKDIEDTKTVLAAIRQRCKAKTVSSKAAVVSATVQRTQP